ncbi:MAG: DNA polymerase III subunit beta [Desulfovermiculus sp.]|nr:DNA polymerase III subunit beta [Desulfovermiculus sp.]
MHVTVTKEEILEGVQKAASIIPAKTGAAFLRTIWMENTDSSLNIMSTDSKLEFSGSYSVQSHEPGLVGVQGRSFYDLLRKLPPGEITFRTDEETLLLEQGRRKYKLPLFDVTWFQPFSPFPAESAASWSGSELRHLIDHILFCIADESTDNMHFMKMTPLPDSEKIEVCGLNGHQFAMVSLAHSEIHPLLGEGGILIAKRYLVELKKWLTDKNIRFTVNQKRLFFTNQSTTEIFSLPLNYDHYPDYNAFFTYFEGETSHMRVDKEELMDSLDRLFIFNTETQRCSYFVFDDQELIIYSQGQDTGEATELLPIEFTGQLDKIIFPTKNVIDVLNHFQSPIVEFQFTSSNGPCKITGEDDPDYLVIIMPVQIDEETYYTDEPMD